MTEKEKTNQNEHELFRVRFNSGKDEISAAEIIEWIGPVYYDADGTATINRKQLEALQKSKSGFSIEHQFPEEKIVRVKLISEEGLWDLVTAGPGLFYGNNTFDLLESSLKVLDERNIEYKRLKRSATPRDVHLYALSRGRNRSDVTP